MINPGYYLNKFTAEQVVQLWDELAGYILGALPHGGAARARKVLMDNIVSGRVQVWALSRVEASSSAKTIGVVSTAVVQDVFLGASNLFIYSLTMLEHVDEAGWTEGLQVLKKYAAVNKCASIQAYTQVPQVKSIVQKLGGRSDYSLVQLEV